MNTPRCTADQAPLLSFATLPTSERELIELALPDLKKIAQARSPRGRRVVDVDDLTQAAATGLLLAFRSFEPSRGVELRHYAASFINVEMARQLKLLASFKSIDTAAAEAQLDRVVRHRAEREEEQAAAAEIVTEAFTVLTASQRRIVSLRYFDELKAIEIASALRRDPDTVRQMLKRARGRMAQFITQLERAA
jgi:RNA polymerase sigma factor (sigma-70 family)